MILEVRVWKTVATKDVFQCQFCVDKDLMKFVSMVSGVIHLWQLTGKHLHLK